MHIIRVIAVSWINVNGVLLKPNATDISEPLFWEVCHLYMNENQQVLNLIEHVNYDSPKEPGYSTI